MSSVDFKFLAVPNVALEMRVLSVYLEYKQSKPTQNFDEWCTHSLPFERRVSSVGLISECRVSTNFGPQCRMSD